MAGKDIQKPQARSLSPSRLPGILLTPGTATSRRKTVSFGTEVVDKGKKDEKDAEGAVIKNGRNMSAQKPEELFKPTRKTSLTRTLESARESQTEKSRSEMNRGSSESKPLVDLNPGAEDAVAVQSTDIWPSKLQSSSRDVVQESIPYDEFDGDMTMDLNEPHSQSGKYWKSEYEQYHKEARAEMQKLLKYKQLAKSYARKKDAEAIELTEKLKEEQRRVLSMEDKISKLSAQIATTGLDGEEDESPELVKELARQTAMALQYKAQVEEFRLALEGNTGSGEGKQIISPRTEQTLLDTQRELRKAREQLRELASLREEMKGLRRTLSNAEKEASKLREENAKLKQDLLHADLRLEKEEKKSERHREASEEQIQKKDEAYKSLQQDYIALKEIAKSQRRDAEYLLKKRHDQVAGLKKELASMKDSESTIKTLQETLQKKSSEHEEIVAKYQKQIDQLRGRARLEGGTDPIDIFLAQGQKKDKPVHSDSVTKSSRPDTTSNTRDSLIPVLSHSTSRPSKTLASSRQAHSEIPDGPPVPQSSHLALSEIVNNAGTERLPSRRSDPIGYTPLSNRFSNMSLEDPDMELPSPEPSLSHITGRTIHERNCQASPRPSMFNMGSSPPKSTIVRPRASDELPRERPVANHVARRNTYLASSRLSSLEGSRTRCTLPPERAAAARARLEQKNAEKKRAQAIGTEKENTRN